MQDLTVKKIGFYVFKQHNRRRLNTLGERLSLVLVIVGLGMTKVQKTTNCIPLGVFLFCIFFCLAIGCFFLNLENRKRMLYQDMMKTASLSDWRRLSAIPMKSFFAFIYILMIYGAVINLSTLQAIVFIFPTSVIHIFRSDKIVKKFMYRWIFFSIIVLTCMDFLKRFELKRILGYFFVGLISILQSNIDMSMNFPYFLFSTIYSIPVIFLEFFFGCCGFKYSAHTYIFVVISSIIHMILKSVKMFDVAYMIKFCWPFSVGIVLFFNLMFLKELPSLVDVLSIVLIYYFLFKSLNCLEDSACYFSGNNNVYMHTLKTYLGFIIKNQDTRNIFCFFILNLTFMFIQMTYGIMSNSLGLISDSIHMAFDCFALFVGLLASIVSKFPPSVAFPFGFSKIEVLSGFMNGLLLLLISISIVEEAISRLLKPEEIHVEKLLFVSIIGLIVNLVGIFLFKHGHHHHHHSDSCFSDAKKFNDSYSFGNNFQHDNHHNDFCNTSINNSHHNANIHGVLLHIFADTLGSIGVIVSTLLIYQFGWVGFDSVASILIAVLITISAIPLIISCAKSLLLIVPHEFEYSVYNALNSVKMHSGIAYFKNPRFWMNNADRSSGVIHIGVKTDHDSNMVRQEVEKILKKSIRGLQDITVVTERCC